MDLLKSGHKKVILTFLFAIFIPSIVIGYLSFNVFYKHRQSVERLLNSTLWSTGENALETVENTLVGYEKRMLDSDNFHYLIQDEGGKAINQNWISLSTKYSGKLFILDPDYKIISPLAGNEQVLEYSHLKTTPSNAYQQQLQKAESFEFVEKDYSKAIDHYKNCKSLAVSPEEISKALAGMGRCLFRSRRFEEAQQTYQRLADQYGDVPNPAGHPYEITATLKLYELAQQNQELEKGFKLLLNLYEIIQAGEWSLHPAAYEFFTAEIESLFAAEQNLEAYPDILSSFDSLQKGPAVYKDILNFAAVLEKRIIPRIKEKLVLNPLDDESNTGRVLAQDNKEPYLVSYTLLPNLEDDRTCYGGFYWNLDSIKHAIIPNTLDNLRLESGFHFKTVDGMDPNFSVSKNGIISEGTLAISYRQFPLPWSLLITHPDIQDLKKSALWENFYYGAFLTLLVALMIFGVILIVRDVSRESETTRLKTEFVHNISHELKTPLTLIRLYGETLQRKKNLSEQEIEDSYEIITKESERLSHLINNVLDFSKIEMGEKEFNFTKGNLGEVVKETLESYRYHLEKNGFSVREEITPGLPEISFDQEALASVLVNLLSNAMKFSPGKKEVTVRLFRADETIVLQVADQGIGVSKKEIPKIFQRFYRAGNKLSPESKGSGLGLALVKHITAAHNGKIEVESVLNKGSTFSIYLPLPEPRKD